MRKIEVLDQNTIDKIAAGEVVERPASVVKELAENAIDAGATAVTVEIKDGGKSLIRITDNGAGMERDQVPLAFLRHATSKIRRAEDLYHVASLGFRGEALSSIAAVSQVELITKTPNAMSGTRYVIEGGCEKVCEEVGAPEGATFLVRNLFFNTPARSKFLKTDATEGGYVSALMEQMALSHPEISFKYMVNSQVKLHTSGNYNRRDVIYQIYGREVNRELLEVHGDEGWLAFDGFVGRPQLSRGNRGFEHYYINGRLVQDKIITRAIEDAYKGFVMQHKFPFAVLEIRMEGNDLDVNVHPAKQEVRFAKGQEVYEAIYRGIRQALEGRDLIPAVSLDKGKAEKKEREEPASRGAVPEPFEKRRREETILRERGNYGEQERSEPKAPFAPKAFLEPKEPLRKEASLERQESLGKEVPLERQEPLGKEALEQPKAPLKAGRADIPENKPEEQISLFSEKLLSEKARVRHKLIGQVFDTYWLVEFGEQFYIIDQHAAHEKVLYERLVKKVREQEFASQYLSPPLVISLSLLEEERLKENLPLFARFGFEIEHFGGREYSVCAVPGELYRMTEEQFFLELLDQLEMKEGADGLELFAGRLATMACKGAVKGNQAMSAAEAEGLIDELLELENPYHCPHGRPTIVSMSKRELEKKFKRIL